MRWLLLVLVIGTCSCRGWEWEWDQVKQALQEGVQAGQARLKEAQQRLAEVDWPSTLQTAKSTVRARAQNAWRAGQATLKQAGDHLAQLRLSERVATMRQQLRDWSASSPQIQTLTLRGRQALEKLQASLGLAQQQQPLACPFSSEAELHAKIDAHNQRLKAARTCDDVETVLAEGFAELGPHTVNYDEPPCLLLAEWEADFYHNAIQKRLIHCVDGSVQLQRQQAQGQEARDDL
eukprot:m.323885 g.323885  ORF g.323885 m.323885 type:complete len:235 (-) comp30699_c0_seq1:271-975(-)